MPAGLLLAAMATNMAPCPVPGAPEKYKAGAFMRRKLSGITETCRLVACRETGFLLHRGVFTVGQTTTEEPPFLHLLIFFYLEGKHDACLRKEVVIIVPCSLLLRTL